MSRGFQLVMSARANGLVDVRKYVSRLTGLKLTVADVDGPMVNGHICLATETDTDDGLPHTLEHLVFMGSHKYPFKGVLDLLANRCLADGTNAWTDVDHTCYTLATAGEDGFLQLLPIYLDHILEPMLTEHQYLTEVHHVNGEGADAGVVYSEMQEYESEMDEICSRALKKAIFPVGCGYRAETGGLLKNLRTTCSNEKVNAFHQAFYRPENVNVIVTGKVDTEKLMQAIAPLEEEIASRKQYGGDFVRPWQSPIAPLEKGEDLRLVCPSDDESRGTIRMGWRGPLGKDVMTVGALTTLLHYLDTSAVSPLERDFIQIPDPYCSEVSCSLYEQSVCMVEIVFTGIPVEKLGAVKPKLLETLNGMISGKEAIDMSRMQDILKQEILKEYSKLETKPHGEIAHAVIGDFLYGYTEEDFNRRMDTVAVSKELLTKSESFWRGLLKSVFGPELPCVTVIGEPSVKGVDELTEKEELRITQQKERLGNAGLEACKTSLETAIAKNEEHQPPSQLIEGVIVKSLEGVSHFDILPSSNFSLDQDQNPDFPLGGIPFSVMQDDVQTNFVELTVTMNTTDVPPELLPFVCLYKEMIFDSPIRRGEKVVPYQDIVTELNRDLVDESCGIKIGPCAEIVYISVKVDAENFEKGVEWARDLVFGLEFTDERVKVKANTMVNTAAEWKRDGNHVSNFLMSHLNARKGTIPFIQNLLRMEKLYQKWAEVEKNPGKVVASLEQLKKIITTPSNVAVHVTCNSKVVKEKSGITALDEPLKRLFPFQEGAKKYLIPPTADLCLNADADCWGRGVVVTIGASESAHFQQTVQGIDSWLHPGLAPLLVFTEYLSQCEGPLWKQIRGSGLAYGAYVMASPDSGITRLVLYRTADPVQAFRESKDIVEKFLDGKVALEPSEFEAAKRVQAFGLIRKESTVSLLSGQSQSSYFRRIPPTYNRTLCEKVWEVTPAEALAAGNRYLRPLLDFKQANSALTCHPSKLSEVKKGFTGQGRQWKVMTLDDEELSWCLPEW